MYISSPNETTYTFMYHQNTVSKLYVQIDNLETLPVRCFRKPRKVSHLAIDIIIFIIIYNKISICVNEFSWSRRWGKDAAGRRN